jgi:DNA circularisation protein N-terminus
MPINPQTKRSDLDVMAKMDLASFRDVEFHVIGMSFAFDQDQVQHKYPDRDAGFIEATGRNPASYSFTAPFRNGIAGSSLLYPVKWRLMAAAMADRSLGVLYHPELGKVNVKPKSQRTDWDPNRRDGVDMALEFVEASSTEDELSDLLGGSSPLGACVAAARDLEGAVGDISPVPTYPDSLSPSPLDVLKKLSGAIAQFKLGIGNLGALVDSYLDGVQQLRGEIESLGNPTSYKALGALDRLFSALLSVQTEAGKKGKPITQAYVANDSNVASVSAAFGMKVDEFVALNPSAARGTQVLKGTQILVYAV